MELNLKLLQQIADSLRSDELTSRAKRTEPRVGVRAKARIVPIVVDDRGIPPIDVWVRDLSCTGIGLVASRPLPQGSLFQVKVPTATRDDLAIQYRVIHAHPIGGGSHVIGATFERVVCSNTTFEAGPLKHFGKRKPTKSAA